MDGNNKSDPIPGAGSVAGADVHDASASGRRRRAADA